MIESQALFGLKFWTFNLGDNWPILEPVFGVEGRSTTVLTLSPSRQKKLLFMFFNVLPSVNMAAARVQQ